MKKKKIKPTHSFFQLVLEGQGLYFQHPIHVHDLSSIHSQKLSKNPKNTQKPPSRKNRQNGVGENREKVEKVVSLVSSRKCSPLQERGAGNELEVE